jgi:lysophospholipase L1-like esterase
MWTATVGLAALSISLVGACSEPNPNGDSPPLPTSDHSNTTSITTAPSPTTDHSAAATAAPTSSLHDGLGLTLLALGDSIAYNSTADCSACTGYVDQYGEALSAATGEQVEVVNMSRHDGLTSTGLLESLSDPTLRDRVAAADAITVSIGFNDAPMLVPDDPCDGNAAQSDLGGYTDTCIKQWAASFGERYAGILHEIADLRQGKPTLLTVIDVFDQWRGFDGNAPDFTAHIAVVTSILEQQNAEICRAAAQYGALCADVHTAFNGAQHDRPSGALLGPDYAHPSQAGNDLIATTLAELGFAPLG